MSSELLSSFSYEGEENIIPIKGAELPNWLAIGGDFRNVNTAKEDSYGDFDYGYIGMQRELQIGIKLLGASFVGSNGSYFGRRESKVLYGLYSWKEGSVKIGKFKPNYGINIPDHTTYSRSSIGLGLGGENYGVELQRVGALGELSLTGILRTKEVGEEGEKYTQKNQGFATRISSFTTKWLQLGLSTMFLTESIKYGGYAQVGFWKSLYLSTDFSEVYDDSVSNSSVFGSSKISYEITRGVNLTYDNNYDKRAGKTGGNNAIGVDWYPRPHFQILGKCIKEGDYWSGLLMTHFYL